MRTHRRLIFLTGITFADRRSMSRAEQFALAGGLLLLLLHAAVATWPGVGTALEYRSGVAAGEPWRLITAHVVHINWPHALINAVAWFVVARLFAGELSPLRQLLVVLVAAGVISVGLALAYARIEWYRGFSGVLHALFFTGATTWLVQAVAREESRRLVGLWLPGALVVGGWIKVVAEQPAASAQMPHAAWLGAATVPQAHLLGAACGTLLGLVFVRSAALAYARNQRKQPEQK
jgi:rhomboid family GlyGly-CTERM serine protease